MTELLEESNLQLRKDAISAITNAITTVGNGLSICGLRLLRFRTQPRSHIMQNLSTQLLDAIQFRLVTPKRRPPILRNNW